GWVGDSGAVWASVWGARKARAAGRGAVGPRTATTAARVAAIEVLVERHVADFAQLLHELLGEKSLRLAAIRGLAAYDHADTPKLILAHYSNLTPEERHDAVATLASRPVYALALLDAIERKAIPP